MAPRRHLSSPFARWLLASMAVAVCVLAGALGAGVAAAAGVRSGDAQHRTAAIARAAADTPSQRTARLRAALRGLHESADRAIRKPHDPILRIGFSVEATFIDELIDGERKAGGIGPQVALAQRALDREIRRVHAVWRAADAGPQVAAIVRQLDGLTVDAAKASGARTSTELNAFKKAHLADIKYAGRRWLVENGVGRQGAVIISRGVRHARLRRVIEQLYRPGAKVGDGGTADKLLDEVRAGCRAVGCEHFKKANERRLGLLTILSEEPLSATERGITGELVGALTKAIRAAGGK